MVTEFLPHSWRDGALFGATPEEAFYVRVGEAFPFSEQVLGRLWLGAGELVRALPALALSA